MQCANAIPIMQPASCKMKFYILLRKQAYPLLVILETAAKHIERTEDSEHAYFKLLK